MEYGHDLVFDFSLSSKPSRLLPIADGPGSKVKDNAPKELFTLETVLFQEAFQAPVVPPEDEPIMEEPETGIEPEGFDKHNFELVRLAKKHPARVPHYLKRNVQPLRPPEAIKPNEKLVGLDSILSVVAPASITYICLADIVLPKKRLKSLPKSLSHFVNVEILLLRGLRLTSLSGCKFPNLRFLDLSHNAISRVANVVNLVKHSPNLDVVNVLYNPCAYKEDVVGRILAVCPFLGIVNEKELSVAERIHALELHGPRSMREELPWLRWDMALDLIPEIAQMRFSHKGWDPQLIVAISLPNCSLTNIAVSTLVNLQTLDVSNNKISDLRNTGIEQCNDLSRINLKHNEIASIQKCVPILAQVKALITVFLDGNAIVLKKNFRSKLIFQTRNLRGSNRTPGLLEIEGTPIQLEERVGANELWANHNDPHDNPQVFRWFMSMCSKYGHVQVKTQLHKMISCSFPSKNLMFASLTGFFMLQHLDLSGNHLSDVGSLEQMELLRIVNLSENPKLSTSKILKQVSQCTRLESFSFFVTTPADHKRTPGSKSYRQSVLKAILFLNRALTVVDNIPVKKEERIDTYADVGGTPEEVETYRFNLALTLNCCSSVTSGGEGLKLHYTEVGAGEQYDPAAITGLRRLTSWGLTSRVCDFSKFINLIELNISHNNLTDISDIGLQAHPNLRVLCATHNSINTPHARIATFLDSIPQLEVVCLRDNPIMRNTDDRMKLLGLLTLQREFAPVLHTLDSTITLNERIDAWKKMEADGGGHAPEQLRFSVVKHFFFLHQPERILGHELTTLNLSYSELGYVDVSEFVNLRELCLLGNRLDSLDGCGIILLQQLEVLDLRFNSISRMESIASIASQLPLLETIGIAGNKCAPVNNIIMSSLHSLRDTRTYRVRFLTLLPEALHVRGHSLVVIDSKEITIEERAQACRPESSAELISSSMPNLPEIPEKKTGTLAGVANKLTLRKGSVGTGSQSSLFDPKMMCWPMALMRKLPATIPFNAITEADFSNCYLTVIDLSILPFLTKLSLAHNPMREQHLERSNIHLLQDLRALDLRGNQLKSLTSVCEVITKIPRLEQLWVDNNPCFSGGSASERVKFFKKIHRGDLLLSLLNGMPVMPPDLVKLGHGSKRRSSISSASTDGDYYM